MHSETKDASMLVERKYFTTWSKNGTTASFSAGGGVNRRQNFDGELKSPITLLEKIIKKQG